MYYMKNNKYPYMYLKTEKNTVIPYRLNFDLPVVGSTSVLVSLHQFQHTSFEPRVFSFWLLKDPKY
jgi:hypothetical protein